MLGRRWALGAVAAALLALGATVGCDAGDALGPEVRRWPLVGDAPALPPPFQWRLLSVDLESIVTPRWSPDGRFLLVRGTRGVGLYAIAPADGALLYAEDGYRGDAAFTAGGDVCRGPALGARLLRIDPATGQGRSTDGPCTVEVRDEHLGALLHDGDDGAVYHDAYFGTITRVDLDGEQHQLENRGAWNVAVSPDGRRIAWCLGTLSEPALLIHDRDGGVRDLGRGAHPAWSPDGRILVYASPTVVQLQGGGHRYESDLYAYDAERDLVTRLTATPDVAELQPAFSPDGRSLAFADWEGDVIFVAPFTTTRPSGDGGAP
jgi:hypothetical protein